MKQELNLVDLKKLLRGRKYSEIPDEERDLILKEILSQIQPSQDQQASKESPEA